MSGITELCSCRPDITRSLVKRFRNKCPKCLKPFNVVRPQYNKEDIVVLKDSEEDILDRTPERKAKSTPIPTNTYPTHIYDIPKHVHYICYGECV